MRTLGFKFESVILKTFEMVITSTLFDQSYVWEITCPFSFNFSYVFFTVTNGMNLLNLFVRASLADKQ